MANKNIQIQDVNGNNLYPVSLIKVTYAQLKSLRDSNSLVPGMQYRITDYKCTTTQDDTQSAGHQFDVIVTADSKNKLNEVARAIRHDSDENLADATSTTVNSVTTKTAYFANSRLEAWKIWYCLDNDTTRFAWADATNGKGVIYRMIDEWNNDCPYDFKNIQFKRYKITKANQSNLIGTYLGLKSNNAKDIETDTNNSIWCYTFNGARIKAQTNEADYDENVYEAKNLDLTVAMAGKEYYNENCGISSCSCCNNIINQKISDFSTKIQFLNNIVLNGSFADKQSWMDFGENILVTANCPNCNFFENNCSDNSFEVGCYQNSFNNGCSNNIFGNNCYNNSFGNNCKYNSFGNNCNSNSFGNNCYNNSFGNYCDSNSFGNNYNNSFGNYCEYNSFGNNCEYNSFGNYCEYNSFGNYCSNNKLQTFYKNNKFENGVINVIFEGIGTNTSYVQNYHIKQGMEFTDTAKHTITAKQGLNYELTIAKKTDGTIIEYNEADLIPTVSQINYHR